MLSVIEGDMSSVGTDMDRIRVVYEESQLLNDFYKRASTDTIALQKLSPQINGLNLGKHEGSFQQCTNFIKDIASLLIRDAAEQERRTLKEAILSSASNLNLSARSLVVICCLASLYGSRDAKRILKPKLNMNEEEAYNSVSDLMAISRVAKLGGMLKEFTPTLEIRFVTFDKSLKAFFNLLKCDLVSTRKAINATHEYKFNVIASHDLFPHLKKEEYFALIEELGSIEDPTTA